jgi:hypothetical protein
MIRFLLLFAISFFIGSDKNVPINLPNPIIYTENDTTLLEKLKQDYEKSNLLFAPEKVYAQLDKTLYQPGETVWFSVFVRNENTLKPTEMSELVHVELYHPNGNKVKDLTLSVKNGLAKGDILISPDWNGGIYTFKAFTLYQDNFDKKKEYIFTKKITVQKVVLPNLRMKLDFEKEAYGAGDKVKADLILGTLDDSPLRFQALDFVVNVAGKRVFDGKGRTNFNGKATIEFDLPKNLNSNDGLVNILVPYLGLTESISRSIPIVLNDIDLQFLPESGHLVSDISNNLAFKALNEFGEPADVSGIIYNEKGKEIQRFSSYHQGMGVVAFLPKKGEKYTAKITQPANIDAIYDLPIATTNEQNAVQVVAQEKDFIKIKITGKRTENLTFVATSKGKIHHSMILRPSDSDEITISTKKTPIGILNLTLLSSDMQPIAERLVFVNAHQRLDIDISTNKKQYRPREKVKMDIRVRDFMGNPVSGAFSLAVVDDKVLSFSDDKQANILGYMLLDSELSGTVKEPNFYFEKAEKHPKKNQLFALDLLMMTQGWRKFNWKKQSELKLADVKKMPETRTIEGEVLNAFGQKMADIKVSIPTLKLKTKTDKNGYFQFKNVDIHEGLTVEVQYKRDIIYAIEVKDYEFLEVFYRLSGNQQNILAQRYTSAESPSISGQMTDKSTGEGLIAASITLYDIKSNTPLAGCSTNINGDYELKHIQAKSYRIEFSYVGYQAQEYIIKLKPKEKLIFSVGLEEGLTYAEEIVVIGYGTRRNNQRERLSKIEQRRKAGKERRQVQVVSYTVPLISNDKTTSGRTITAADIQNLPSRSIAGIAATTAGVTISDDMDDLNMRGSRSNSTIIYVDGIRVNGVTVPQTVYDNQIDIILSGSSASNNDTIERRNFGKRTILYKSAPPTSGERLQKHLTQIKGRTFQNPPLYILDGKAVPEAVVYEILSTVKPYIVQKFKIISSPDGYEKYGDDGMYGVYEIRTKAKKRKGKADYKAIIYNKIDTFKAQYQRNLKEYNQKNSSIDNVVNGIELAQINIENTLKSITTQQDLLIKTEEQLDGLGQFMNKRITLDKKIERTSNVQKYLYAQQFSQGFYAGREFYTPKYDSKKAVQPEARNDFRQTIYWNPNVELGKNGKASIEFYTNDAITTFRTTVEGVGQNGGIGRNEATFYSELPLGLISKMPSVLLTGDQLKLPLTVMNNTAEVIKGKLTIDAPTNFRLAEALPATVTLEANEKRTIFVTYDIVGISESSDLDIRLESDGAVDAFTTSVKILQRGFPVGEVITKKDDETALNVVLKDVLDTNIIGTLTLYSNQVGEIMEVAKRMIRQPSGCFEQVSSSNYPNVMVYQYLKEYNQLDEATKNKLENYINRGYKKLTSYEIEGGGFDWFGRPPAHEGLTAYGLMQFVEMSKIYPVSQEMIDRTYKWLLERRDGKGSWNYRMKGAHSWKAATAATDAYIVWALVSSGYGQGISKEMNAIYKRAISEKDPYVMALVANSLFQLKDSRAVDLMNDLLKMQQEDGFWEGTTRSVVNSSGRNLKIETTAITALAFIEGRKSGLFSLNSQYYKAIKALTQSKTSYGFGSTQGTVMVMKALIENSKINQASVKTDNQYTVFVNDKKIMTGSYAATDTEPIIIEGLGRHLNNGNNAVKVTFSNDTTALPYDFDLRYTTATPLSTPKCAVAIQTTLNNVAPKIGETVRLTTTLKNTTDKAVPTTVALVGIPSGLSIQSWQLKELMDKKVVDYYELMDGYIVFHYRELAADATKIIHLDLKADISGQYEAPASCAYLYYTNELVDWAKGLEVGIL